MRLPNKILGLTTCLLLASTALAQRPCSNLEISGSGKAGTKLTLSLSGAHARALAFLAIGGEEGDTRIEIGPLGTLALGLKRPFHMLPLAFTDGKGDASAEVRVPNGLRQEVTVFVQGFTYKVVVQREPKQGARVSLEFCTSNVVKKAVGGSE